MKKLIAFLFLFAIATTAFAGTRTGYYTAGQTKSSIMEKVKLFEDQMVAGHFEAKKESEISKNDYVILWSLASNGSTTSAKVRYQFFDDRLSLTISDATYLTKSGKLIILLENDPIAERKNVFKNLDEAYVGSLLKFLEVSESRIPSIKEKSTDRSVSDDYDQVTMRYAADGNKGTAKANAQYYIDNVLRSYFKVKYNTDANADKQEIEYKMEDDLGSSTAIFEYQFREKDFTIKIKSINYYNFNKKSDTKVSKNSTKEEVSKLYDLFKLYFLDKQASYITTKAY